MLLNTIKYLYTLLRFIKRLTTTFGEIDVNKKAAIVI